MNRETASPAKLGYRMPAEWEPHEGTWLSWPKDPVTWPGRVPQVEAIFEQMIVHLSPHEKVFLLVDNEKAEVDLYQRLKKAGAEIENVLFHQIPTVDSWTRDYAPNFIVRQNGNEKELAMNHWQFNAWGGKYAELIGDTLIPKKLEPVLKIPRFIPDMVLEGGSIEVNGEGAVLTTEQCLLNSNRNPELSKEKIETKLQDFLGIEKVLWLGEGLEGDDTDGHIDDITRFVDSQTIVTVIEEDSNDANFLPLKNNLDRLKSFTNQKGRPFNVIPLPMPGFIGDQKGRLPASYANFYIANNVVLVPVYHHPNDEKALAVLKELFPKRDVVGIDCEPLVYGFGAIHCVTPTLYTRRKIIWQRNPMLLS